MRGPIRAPSYVAGAEYVDALTLLSGQRNLREVVLFPHLRPEA